MSRYTRTLTSVEIYPYAGPERELWTDDISSDALVRAARSFCELLDQALPSGNFRGPASKLRILTDVGPWEEAVLGDALRISTLTTPQGSLYFGNLYVPRGVEQASPREVVALVAEVLRRSIRSLGSEFNWDEKSIDKIIQETSSVCPDYIFIGDWKTDKSGRLRARVQGQIRIDGIGVGCVEFDGDDDEASYSDVWTCPASIYRFRRSAKSLRWISKDTVSLETINIRTGFPERRTLTPKSLQQPFTKEEPSSSNWTMPKIVDSVRG